MMVRTVGVINRGSNTIPWMMLATSSARSVAVSSGSKMSRRLRGFLSGSRCSLKRPSQAAAKDRVRVVLMAVDLPTLIEQRLYVLHVV